MARVNAITVAVFAWLGLSGLCLAAPGDTGTPKGGTAGALLRAEVVQALSAFEVWHSEKALSLAGGGGIVGTVYESDRESAAFRDGWVEAGFAIAAFDELMASPAAVRIWVREGNIAWIKAPTKNDASSWGTQFSILAGPEGCEPPTDACAKSSLTIRYASDGTIVVGGRVAARLHHVR